jgi:hypothetical protein
MEEKERAILKWLDQHGFPMEMRVGRILREAGWEATHATWYLDSETSKHREIDIVATTGPGGFDIKGCAYIHLVIECKQSRAKPWVVFSAENTPPPAFLRGLLTVDEFSRAVLAVSRKHKIDPPEFLKFSRVLAHGVVKAHSEGKTGDPTAPYAALRGAASAALATATVNARWSVDNPAYPFAHVYVPMVVLDGELYEYVMEEGSGEPALQSINYAQVSIPTESGRAGYVQLITETHLRESAGSMLTQAVQFSRAMVEHAGEVIERAREHFGGVPRDTS